MNEQEVQNKLGVKALLEQLDDMVAEEKAPRKEEFDIGTYYQALSNPQALKFFENERDRYLSRHHDAKTDPNGHSTIRDMAILEYIQDNINLIKQLLK